MIERYKTLQMDYAFYRRDSLQSVSVIYGPCCERKVHFIEGNWGQPWSSRCSQSIYWLVWNGHFIEALLSWYSVGGRLKDAHGCTVILATVGSESNTRVRLETFIIYCWASHLKSLG